MCGFMCVRVFHLLDVSGSGRVNFCPFPVDFHLFLVKPSKDYANNNYEFLCSFF